MKKLIILVSAAFLFATPAFASDEDVLARIEALEQRVTALENMLSSSDETETPLTTGEVITLDVGTWIVGNDISAGKYNLTCANDAGSVCYVYKSLDDKLNDEIWADMYSVSTEAYKNMYAESFKDSDSLDVMLDMIQTIIYNVYLQDGQCVVIEGAPMTFTP